ncbi:hypothetical protein H310_06743 [Aphanomyces invadans]|uniref:Nucleotide-diphospho-sugar transferase n=1 Tax=Aphanomyces invadans TaxID=157072 RepID=A0A024U4F5_9STRA|nr:hypothetical protein H310_06743 [Aphanomyces invadans]ETW01134.1 hypothetical protein H310_06743 [Aphanomyces invadans]|eukprot:XP_008870132.1 hypothetical protein H310_06743 [Aphanomyces invadans]
MMQQQARRDHLPLTLPGDGDDSHDTAPLMLGINVSINIRPEPRLSEWRKIGLGILLAFGGIAAAAGIAYGVWYYMREAMMMNPALDTALSSDPLPYDRVPALWSDDFECLGWRATAGCDPGSERTPQYDRTCDARIALGDSGFCEVRNRTSLQVYRVMASTCRSVIGLLTYTCNMAEEFTDFPKLAATYTHDPAPQFSGVRRGIVFSVYKKALPGLFAIIKLLRSFGCTLPVEIFYRPDELHAPSNVLVQALLQSDDRVALREITDPRATKFRTKPYAVYHSSFDQVLLLDCDNIPLRDPTYLFDSPVFASHSAIFWPDLWQPKHTIFSVISQSLLWQYVDMPFVDMFEQESGQVLVDRRRATDALHKLMAYTFGPTKNSNGTLIESMEFLYGDKDLFRFAWRNASTSFYFIQTPPAYAGMYSWYRWISFCGLAMVQYDPDGNMLFLHRNQVKLTAHPYQVPLFTHILRFNGRDPSLYSAECKGRQDGYLCWGFQWPWVPVAMETIDWADNGASHVNIHQAESKAVRYAIEAGAILGDVDTSPAPTPLPLWRNWWIDLVVCSAIFMVWCVWQHVAQCCTPQKKTMLRSMFMSRKKRKTSTLPSGM